MKIAPIFISKKTIMKKIANRAEKRINKNTAISEALSDNQKELLNKNIDSIARYASKKGALLEFVPAKDLFEGGIQMNVYKKGITVNCLVPHTPFKVTDRFDLSGKVILDDKVKKGSDFVNGIRANAKSIISNDTNWNNRVTEVIL